jgi:hypothetical protein
MTGSTYGFDDGGDMPDDNSGALPVDNSSAQTADNSGALPVAAPEPQQQPQSRSGLDFNAAHVPGNAKRIIQYLMGGDAAPPEVANKFAQGVKHENPGISDDDANLIAVHKAGEMGGPAAAWAMVQYNRQAYNAKQSFANAALNGVDGKAGDIHAATQAATQASTHILDGSHVTFMPEQGGVTAAVRLPGTSQRANYRLSPQAFSQWLNVGGEGQWDKVMENGGAPAVLQKLAGAQRAKSQGDDEDEPSSQSVPDATTRQNMKRDFTDLSGGGKQDYTEWNKNAGGGIDDEVKQRANSLYPSASQGGQRSQYMASETSREAELENKKDIAEGNERARLGAARERKEGTLGAAKERAGGQVAAAKERAGGQVDAARVRSEGYAKAQQEKAKLALQKMAQQSRDANERNRINVATRLINNPNWATQSADERNAILKQYGLDQLVEPAAPASTPPAAAPAAPAAAPSRQTQNASPPRLKLPDGKYYIKGPDGKAMLDPNQ